MSTRSDERMIFNRRLRQEADELVKKTEEVGIRLDAFVEAVSISVDELRRIIETKVEGGVNDC